MLNSEAYPASQNRASSTFVQQYGAGASPVCRQRMSHLRGTEDRATPENFRLRVYRLTFFLSHASTIFVGSIASRSICSSRIFPSFPIRKLTRRAALYLST